MRNPQDTRENWLARLRRVLPDASSLATRMNLLPGRRIGLFGASKDLTEAFTRNGFPARLLPDPKGQHTPSDPTNREAGVDELLCFIATEGELSSPTVDKIAQELDPDGHLWIIAWRAGRSVPSSTEREPSEMEQSPLCRPAQGEGTKARALFSSHGFVEDRALALSPALYAIRFRRA